jgi:hypothetical protein
MEFPPQFPRVLTLDLSQKPSVVLTPEEKTLLQQKSQNRDYDVFLCYHSRNTAFVREIGERLKAWGLLPWFDEWESQPGAVWPELLEHQLGRFKALAICMGSDGTAPWQQITQQTFIQQFVEQECPIIPVLLPGFEGELTLPQFFQAAQSVDFRAKAPAPLKQLIQAITGEQDIQQGRKIEANRDYFEHITGNVFTGPVYFQQPASQQEPPEHGDTQPSSQEETEQDSEDTSDKPAK